MPPTTEPRRIAAVVLPDLLCELGNGMGSRKRKPFGVVLVDEDGAGEPVKATALLDAVSSEARRYGVREGQSIAEACALLAHLEVLRLERGDLGAALETIAETALAFGATVAFEEPDTVWVDVTGAAHLFGGEEALAVELTSRVRKLGHVVRVAISAGPRLAQALGRFGDMKGSRELGERGVLVVAPGREREVVRELPVAALPLDAEARAWLVRLGVLTLGELGRIPRASAAARLGDLASVSLDLCEGKDTTPLVAHQPAALITEESSWDEPASGIEPLLFVLRGLAARLSSRLAGRGEAAQKLALGIEHDHSIARHRGVPIHKELLFDLSSPLWREDEIRRVVSSRLERTRLEAPSVGLRLEAPAVIRALGRQLDLSRVSGGVTGEKGLESLPVLLAELGADIGKERLGVLGLADAHRPEKKSELRPALAEPESRSGGKKKKKKKKRDPLLPLRKVRPAAGPVLGAPSRFLPQPLPIDVALRVGATLRVDHRLYSIERITFVERLELVEWWTGNPVARDYLWLLLRGTEGVLEAMVYVDRDSGKRFLQAVAD